MDLTSFNETLSRIIREDGLAIVFFLLFGTLAVWGVVTHLKLSSERKARTLPEADDAVAGQRTHPGRHSHRIDSPPNDPLRN